jgi:ribulose-5-phosphate 4-epimerase/fuculose-1-phosphate aldolase
MSVTPLHKPSGKTGDLLTDARRDLAAAFRWTARLDMHEGIANHFSLAVSDDGARFLLNPYGTHFSQITASDLLLLDAGNPDDGERDDVDPTAWCIHGAIHRKHPHARCILHVHSKYATVLSCLEDSNLPPIDQTTMRYFNRVAVDSGFDGMGLGAEAERLAGTLGNHSTLMMGNHGVLVVGETVARAFDNLYYFERAAQTVITAYQTGKPLRIASDAVAEKTARQWEDYREFADRHFSALKGILEREEPDYRD